MSTSTRSTSRFNSVYPKQLATWPPHCRLLRELQQARRDRRPVCSSSMSSNILPRCLLASSEGLTGRAARRETRSSPERGCASRSLLQHIRRRPSPVARARACGSVDGPLWAVDSSRHRDGSLALRAPVRAIKVRHGYYVMSDCCKARTSTSGYGFDQIPSLSW